MMEKVVGLKSLDVIFGIVVFEGLHVELVDWKMGALGHGASVIKGPPGTARCSSVRGMREVGAPPSGSKVVEM